MENILDKFETYCKANDKANIEHFLTHFKSILINHSNGYFFDIIADHGDIETMKIFIQHGQDPRLDNNYAIFKCADMKRDDCVMYLLSVGCSIDALKCNINYNYYLISC